MLRVCVATRSTYPTTRGRGNEPRSRQTGKLTRGRRIMCVAFTFFACSRLTTMMLFFLPRPRCMAKSEERKARIEREAEEELLRKMPKQTRHAALLRQRVGQVRICLPWSFVWFRVCFGCRLNVCACTYIAAIFIWQGCVFHDDELFDRSTSGRDTTKVLHFTARAHTTRTTHDDHSPARLVS